MVSIHRCRATVEYKANKGSNTYETMQHGRSTGEYRIEVTGPERVAGSVTCSDGGHIYQYSSKVNGRVSLLAIVGAVMAYQIVGTAAEWALTGSFTDAIQDFRLGLPGIMLQIFGGWLVLKALQRV